MSGKFLLSAQLPHYPFAGQYTNASVNLRYFFGFSLLFSIEYPGQMIRSAGLYGIHLWQGPYRWPIGGRYHSLGMI